MILADKIIEERKKCGWSQEELAERLQVSRQSVSKWESAQAVPDLKRVLQMAELFGVSTDYLLKDSMDSPNMTDPAELAGQQDNMPARRKVSLEEANAFLRLRKEAASWIALGVLLCIVSSAPLMFLAGAEDVTLWGMDEGVLAGIGLAILLVMVACGVYLFVTTHVRMQAYEYLEREEFETEYGVTGLVQERRSAYQPVLAQGIAVGVVLCILACVPLVITGAMEASDYIICAMVSVLLVLVSIGVYIILRVTIVKGGYDILLQEGDYTAAEKRFQAKAQSLGAIYWCVATAIYLGWSLSTFRWHLTWIVWPVAGVLHMALRTFLKIRAE